MASQKKFCIRGVLARTICASAFLLVLVSAPALYCQESAEPAAGAGGEMPGAAEAKTAADESLRAVVELPFEREIFEYIKEGRRDPFLPLVPKEEGAEPNVNNLTLTGIIWGFGGPMAVVKEKGATGHVLREGDKVSGGEVEEITMSSITFRLSEYGVVTRYTLTLKGEGRK